MVVLPPGTLLQLMYLGDRLKDIPRGRFIEVGPGSGEITSRLLRAGWCGTIYDFSEETVIKLKQRFALDVASGRLAIVLGDHLSVPPSQPESRVDVIISCMVLEHLDGEAERKFMEISRTQLKEGGAHDRPGSCVAEPLGS